MAMFLVASVAMILKVGQAGVVSVLWRGTPLAVARPAVMLLRAWPGGLAWREGITCPGKH